MIKGLIILSFSVLAACGGEEGETQDAAKENGLAEAGQAARQEAAVASSFDCAQSESEATDLVCQKPMLARMDNELMRLYALAENGPYMTPDRLKELQAVQRGWIAGRDECWKADDMARCVTASYAMRIHEIRQGYFDARRDHAAGISNGPLALACDGTDFGVAATFVNADPSVVYLQWKATGIALTQVPSGSGNHYEGFWNGGRAALFTKGEDAMLTLPGEAERNCRFEEIG